MNSINEFVYIVHAFLFFLSSLLIAINIFFIVKVLTDHFSSIIFVHIKEIFFS